MLDALKQALALREERVTLGDIELTVREMSAEADVSGWDDAASGYHLLVRCVYGPDGALAFGTDDIPALQAGSKRRLLPLLTAVRRVNGLDVEAEEKNSAAAPG